MKRKRCKQCGKLFIPNTKSQLYCHVNCKAKYRYRKNNPIKKVKCEYCGKEFTPKSNKYKYCCHDHYVEMNRILTKRRMYKNRKEFPEIFFNELGSRGTSTNYKLHRDDKGEPDFNKERKWLDKEKKLLGIK